MATSQDASRNLPAKLKNSRADKQDGHTGVAHLHILCGAHTHTHIYSIYIYIYIYNMKSLFAKTDNLFIMLSCFLLCFIVLVSLIKITQLQFD